MTAWSRLPVEERMRIRKGQAFNIVDGAIRVAGCVLWFLGACLVIPLVVVLVYDIFTRLLPWWLTSLVIVVLVVGTYRRRVVRKDRRRVLDQQHRAKYGRDPQPWTRPTQR